VEQIIEENIKKKTNKKLPDVVIKIKLKTYARINPNKNTCLQETIATKL
jgi:hypothetical protein